jgi:hypothetical protein
MLEIISICIANSFFFVFVTDNNETETEWIAKTSKERTADPPTPEELMADTGMRKSVERYTEFADRMVRAVYGKSRYSPSSNTTLFEDLVPPSQEAFALLLYKNGYQNWVWRHNHACLTSDGSEDTVGGETEGEEECPQYRYTRRTEGSFTGWNGGWRKEGMTTYNELYKKVKEDRQTDNGAFGKVYREHRASLCGMKRKRRTTGGADHVVASDDLEDLWTAAATGTTGV